MADNRRELLNEINKVSFAVNDVTLFLNTHPDNQEALQYFAECNRKRQNVLEKYADQYGPLTLDSTCDEPMCWRWNQNPWPWQKGGC